MVMTMTQQADCVPIGGVQSRPFNGKDSFVGQVKAQWERAVQDCQAGRPCRHFVDVVFAAVGGSEREQIDWHQVLGGFFSGRAIDAALQQLDSYAASLLEYAEARSWSEINRQVPHSVRVLYYLTLTALLEGDAMNSRNAAALNVSLLYEQVKDMRIGSGGRHQMSEFMDGQKWLEGNNLILQDLQSDLSYPLTRAALLVLMGVPVRTVVHLVEQAKSTSGFSDDRGRAREIWLANHQKRLLALGSSLFPLLGVYYQQEAQLTPTLIGQSFVLFPSTGARSIGNSGVSSGGATLTSTWQDDVLRRAVRYRCPTCGTYMRRNDEGKLVCPRCSAPKRGGFKIAPVQFSADEDGYAVLKDDLFSTPVIADDDIWGDMVRLYNTFAAVFASSTREKAQAREALARVYARFREKHGLLHAPDKERLFHQFPPFRRLLMLERHVDADTGEVVLSKLLDPSKPWGEQAIERPLPNSVPSAIEITMRDVGRLDPGRLAKVMGVSLPQAYRAMLSRSAGVRVFCDSPDEIQAMPVAAAFSGDLVRRVACTCEKALNNRMFAGTCLDLKRALAKALLVNKDQFLAPPTGFKTLVERAKNSATEDALVKAQINHVIMRLFAGEDALSIASKSTFLTAFVSEVASTSMTAEELLRRVSKAAQGDDKNAELVLKFIVQGLGEGQRDEAIAELDALLQMLREHRVKMRLQEAGLLLPSRPKGKRYEPTPDDLRFKRDALGEIKSLYVPPEMGALADYAALPPDIGPDVPSLYRHQRDVVAQAMLTRQNGMGMGLFHSVGYGKTFSMAATIASFLYHGLAEKPMVVVPNAILHQFAEDIQRMIPGAKTVVADSKSTKSVPNFWRQLEQGDWDVLLVAKSVFEKQLGVREADREDDPDAKSTVEALDVDMLVADEAHHYRNAVSSSLTVKDDEGKSHPVYGLSGSVSGVARKFLRTAYFVRHKRVAEGKTQGVGVLMATATPVVNSITDLVALMYAAQGDGSDPTTQIEPPTSITKFLKEHAIVGLSLEPDPVDDTLREVYRVTALKGDEAIRFSHVLMSPDEAGIKLPPVDSKVIRVKPTEETEQIRQRLIERAQRIREGRPEKEGDNILAVMGAIDQYALMHSADDPNSPPRSPLLDTVVDEALRIHEINRVKMPDGKEATFAQLFFIDWGTPSNEPHRNAFLYLRGKLAERGISPDQIAIYHPENPEGLSLEAIRQKVNNGEIKFIITSKIGSEGLNIQAQTNVVHHVTIPWTSAAIEQRNGRVLRPGGVVDKLDNMAEELKETEGVKWQPTFADGQPPRVMVRTYVMPGMGSYRLWLVSLKERISRIVLSGADEHGLLTDPSASVKKDDVIMLAMAEAMGDETMQEWVKAKMEVEYWQRVHTAWKRKETVRRGLLQEAHSRTAQISGEITQLMNWRDEGLNKRYAPAMKEGLAKLEKVVRTAKQHKFARGFSWRKYGVRLSVRPEDGQLALRLLTPWGGVKDFLPPERADEAAAVMSALWEKQKAMLEARIAERMQKRTELTRRIETLSAESTFPYAEQLREAQERLAELEELVAQQQADDEG